MTCHSSWASTRTAPASLSSAAGLGKTPTTSVRRLTSLLSRSSGLVDQIFFQWAAGNPVKASWGDQMRNYVLNPYQIVKDLRTGYEVGNPTAVFDGDLDGFIEAGIRWRKGAERAAEN